MKTWCINNRWIPFVILLLAIGVRVWGLDWKPPHFDEGINGWFADGIKEKGFFSYDPNNYHGPLHFYAIFLSQTLFGRSVEVLRLPAILASLASIGVLFAFARYFGQATVRLAALAMALSPAYVFYGRYSIHESWLVFFNLVFVLGALGLWREGTRNSLFLAIGGITGMILTKETYLVQIGCLLLAVPCLKLWNNLVPCEDSLSWTQQKWTWSDLFLGSGWGALAIVFFYSGTFYHLEGLHGLWQTFAAWFQTGVQNEGHAKTAFAIAGTPLNWYWISLMIRYEWPAFLGLLATVWCVKKCPSSLRLLAIYGAGLLLAYSLVPYKTPWCIIAFLWPFYLVGAATVMRFQGKLRVGFIVLFVLATLGCAGIMMRLNFWHYDDEKEPYVYVQTFREIQRLTDPILQAAKADPQNYQMRGEILLSSYYPLPWILGDFPNIAYFGAEKWPERLSGDFVAGDAAKAEAIATRLTGDYVRVHFRLRDAQEPCIVFFRKEKFPQFPGNPEESMDH